MAGLLCICGDSEAQDEGKRPGLLFGGALIEKRKVVVEVDKALPTGALRLMNARPEAIKSACHAVLPLCVHGDGSPLLHAQVLRTMSQAFRSLIFGLGLPAPQTDTILGGGPELDIYLSNQSNSLAVRADGQGYAPDTSSGHCVLPAQSATLASAAQCVGEAIALGLDAAEAPSIRSAYGAYVALLTQGPSTQFLQQVDDAQANPQLALLRRESTGRDRAGALFFAYAEAQLGLGKPGELATALLQLSRSTQSKHALRYNNEPDLMDVLRRAVNNNPSDVADLMQGFAISRAFLGSRADGQHAPEYRFLGDSGRIRIDWSLKYSSLPRNVAGTRAVEPTGSVYLWLELDQVLPPSQNGVANRLGVRASWEQPVPFKWSAIALDKAGREIRRWEFPYLERGTKVEKSLQGFEGAAGILFVGVNLGGVDLSHPFDPDYEPWEPHSFSLYLSELPK